MSNINDRFSVMNLSITGNAIRSVRQDNGVQGQQGPTQNRVGNFQTETGSRFIRQTAPTDRESIAQSVSNSRNRFQQPVNDRPLSFAPVSTENIRNLGAPNNNNTRLVPLLQSNREPFTQQRTVINSNIQQSPFRRLPSIANSSSPLQQQENSSSLSNRRTQGRYPIHVVTLGLEQPEGVVPARDLAPQIIEERSILLPGQLLREPSQEWSEPPNTTNISPSEEVPTLRTARPPSTSRSSQPRFPRRLVSLDDTTISRPLNESLEESLTPSKISVTEEIQKIETPRTPSFSDEEKNNDFDISSSSSSSSSHREKIGTSSLSNSVPDLNTAPLQRPMASNGRGERQNFADRIRRDISTSNVIPLEAEFSSLFSQEEAIETPFFNTASPIEESNPSSPQISISSSEDTVQERPVSDQREITPPGKTISPVDNGEDYFTDEEEGISGFEDYHDFFVENDRSLKDVIDKELQYLKNQLQENLTHFILEKTSSNNASSLSSRKNDSLKHALNEMKDSIDFIRKSIVKHLASENVNAHEEESGILIMDASHQISQAAQRSLEIASHFLDTDLTLTPLEAHEIALPAVEGAIRSLHFFMSFINGPFEGLRAPGNNNQRDEQNDVISAEIITLNDLAQQIISAENLSSAELRDLFINFKDQMNNFNNRFEGALH